MILVLHYWETEPQVLISLWIIKHSNKALYPGSFLNTSTSLSWSLSLSECGGMSVTAALCAACRQTQEHRGCIHLNMHARTHTRAPLIYLTFAHLHKHTPSHMLTHTHTQLSHTHTNRRMEKLEDIPHLLSLVGLPEFALA